MSAPTCKSFQLSSALNITEEAIDVKKQGIVSILRCETETPTKATSLRRTLSADMSSQKWLTQQGLMSTMKKSPSSVQFPVSSSFEEVEKVENRSRFDIWSSIISQKAADEEAWRSSPPYVHPLVKRSASCLSEKSLEICTESLGSETGSDGFSSETGESEEDTREDQELQHQNQEPTATATMMPCFVGKKATNPSFPPPIPSLSGKDGASRRLKTHRDNGRLVVEAVSMPSRNNFLAQRQDGRLVLTFANTSAINDHDDDEEEEIENEIEGVIENRCCEIEQAPKLPSGAMNVHRLVVMMNKPIWLANRNPTWPKSFDQIVNFGEEREGKLEPKTLPPLAQSLPPRPPTRLIPSPLSKAVAATGEGPATTFNAYEYYWRRPNHGASKAAAATIINPLAQQSQPLKNSKNPMAIKDHKQLQVDFIAPLFKGCKEPRRSLLFWEPYCIATS